MRIFIRPRGEGKTESLIKLSAENNNYIVCHNMNECSRIQSVAKEMGLIIPFPITYSEFLDNEYYNKGVKGFLIDNVDMLLESITNVPINAISITFPTLK